MSRFRFYGWLAGTVSCAALLMSAAQAAEFNIPAGDLKVALDTYARQSGVALLFSTKTIRGIRTRGVKGNLPANDALTKILAGTGLAAYHDPDGSIGIGKQSSETAEPVTRLAEGVPAHAISSVETVVVTSSKIKGDIQTVPIAITALSQEQLTSRQIAGGPDLVKEVPNLTFSKTNFTGYNIEIRGIGTQAISVTTDPAVAVASNDIPFLRNHFFEQEFYDISQVEVLRGPQGTLYGRNATAGVVNVVSAKPTDQFEAMLSADWGNYSNRRYEGMVNIPIVDDRVDLRIAAEWTKRNGYSNDTTLNTSIDGRDLWSNRITLGWKPAENLHTYLIWEHFQENDDRLRSGKQLCKTAPIPDSVNGVTVGSLGNYYDIGDLLSQGCGDTSLYSASAFEVPNGYTLAYGSVLNAGGAPVRDNFNIYGTTTQSRNLRDIESAVLPKYRAKNDTLEFNADWALSPGLTFTSQTGYNKDVLWSSEDYDRFDSAPGIFTVFSPRTSPDPAAGQNGIPADAAIFCDPQLGCSDRLVLQDLSREHAWQISQEFRLASSFNGPFNFSVGANALHYETDEDYFVFINSVSLFAIRGSSWVPGISDNEQCLTGGYRYTDFTDTALLPDVQNCGYIDPNSLANVNGEGHNYFLSKNPYILNSYAAFAEVYYNIFDDLKLTTGIRFTDDQKHFDIIPSELLIPGYGYPQTRVMDQKWGKFTGREVVNWTPKLDFTDQTLVYASYSHGYKAGGANPPGALLGTVGESTSIGILTPIHPLSFKPEYVEAFELGTKNTLLDGGLTLNGDVFYYDYKNYQISEIVDRTAINNNYNAHVEGGEFEASWEPLPGLKLNLAQGFEDGTLDKGDRGIDLMDRTAGTPGWMVVKPYVTIASNCILPSYVVAAAIEKGDTGFQLCSDPYIAHLDPITGSAYDPGTTSFTNGNSVTYPYPGFDPLSVDPNAPANVNNGLGLPPNNGEGFSKNLGGNQLPNAPHFTTSLTAEYTIPVSEDWAATLHGDFYWQSQQWARVFEDRIDKIRGYSNVNVALVLTSADGWQVMGYLKNVFNTTTITGTFLNSDDTGLTTNVFLTDPRLFGVRVMKNW